MLHNDYDIQSINSNGSGDCFVMPPFPHYYYPDDYYVKEIQKEEIMGDEERGKEIYGGKHRFEYLVCSWKNGKKNGEGLLYDQYGELIFRGTFIDDNLEGEAYYYHEGAVSLKCYFFQNKRDTSSHIVYTESSIFMEEFNAEGYLIYRGGFNDDRQREGYGAEYVRGELKCYGLYENNVSIQKLKTFSGNIMREYHKENDDEVAYIGEYKDSIEEGFPREGEGREFADGGLLFHGMYKDNKRHGKGTFFYIYGIARSKGVWENGVCKHQVELDNRGFYKNVKYDGRSVNSIHIIDDQITLNPRVENFHIGDKMCNGDEIKRLVLRDMERIKSITVGNHCFSNVETFEVINLPNLVSIVIGRDSFTSCDRNDNKPSDGCNKDICKEANSRCYLANCPQLTDIKFFEGSFSSYCDFIVKSRYSIVFINRSSKIG